jgi:hypothetical protein
MTNKIEDLKSLSKPIDWSAPKHSQKSQYDAEMEVLRAVYRAKQAEQKNAGDRGQP